MVNEFCGEQWITKSSDQRKIEIREVRTKLAIYIFVKLEKYTIIHVDLVSGITRH